ncbi:MAG: hypothetical protein K2X81_15605, partial [Candidatus Obscuribacterales bacterium]|nr:hypothetical protein [Candidatus Obscuribacterales bacterium]
CADAERDDETGSHARERISQYILNDGISQEPRCNPLLIERGTEVLSRLMRRKQFSAEILPLASFVIAYSQKAQISTRLKMLEVFAEYYAAQASSGRAKCDLSKILFDALNLEVHRSMPQQSEEFRNKLMDLLSSYQHPAAGSIIFSNISTVL